MGEILKHPVPSQPLKFTGERLTTEVSGQIESEHYHRYFLADVLQRRGRFSTSPPAKAMDPPCSHQQCTRLRGWMSTQKL